MNRILEDSTIDCRIEVPYTSHEPLATLATASFGFYKRLVAEAQRKAFAAARNNEGETYTADFIFIDGKSDSPDTPRHPPIRTPCPICNNTPGISIVASHTCAMTGAIDDPEGTMALLLALTAET